MQISEGLFIQHTSPSISFEGEMFKGFIRFNTGFHLGISTSFSIFIRGLGMFETALHEITFDEFPFNDGRADAGVKHFVLLLKDAGKRYVVYLFLHQLT